MMMLRLYLIHVCSEHQSYMTKQFDTPVRSVLFLCHLPYVISCCTARGPRHVVVVFFSK